MANTIILKKSATVGKVPLSSDLQIGELAVNLADQKLYSKNPSGTVVLVGSGGGGSGDVIGPSSATDNAITRYDGTTGKLIQNSTVTLDDSGNVTGLLSEQWDITNTPPAIVAGLEAWDDGNGTLEVGLKGGNVSYKYGQQEYALVYNGSGVTMTKGQVVYIVGAQGNRVDVRLALANEDSNSAGTIGLVAESIANGAEGFVQLSGTMFKLNTNGLTAGATIYLSPTTAGAYTTTKPQAPQHTVILGWIERVSTTVGSIFIKVDNGYELDELHNVKITSPASGDTLIYDAVQGLWVNNDITAGTGISVTNGAGTISIANTAPDQTVALTGAGTTTVTGTYPNFTITSADQYQGTVTSVSGTGTVSGLTLSGTVTGSGNLTLGGAITGFATSGANTDLTSVALTTGTISTTPSGTTDIVNKAYADSLAAGTNFHQACNYATTAALSPANTYNNGTSGVGATLTGNNNGTLTVDGYTFVSGDVGKRILVKNEAAGANNGVYTLTQAGTGSLPYILTRATDYDQVGTGVDEIAAGDLMLVLAGTANANTQWIQQTPAPITIGTTALTFIQFGNGTTYAAGTGLTLTGSTFSITNVGTANTYGSASQVPVFTTNAQGQVTAVTNTNIAIAGSAVTGDITGNAANVTGTVAVANGGTGQTTYTDGELLIGNSTGNTLAKSTLTAGSGISITNGAGSITIAASGGAGVTSVTGTSPVVSSGGTTPAISLAAAYGDTLNPYASKTANYVLAAPNGTAGVPTFRAIVAADIPTLNQNTTGTAGGLSATLAIGSGGTGQTAFTANYIHYGSFSTSANLTYNGTDFTCGGNVTAYSDERVKTNWRNLPVDFIDQLVNVKHGIYDRTDNGITQVGVGAQSLQTVLEQAVIEGEDGRLSVSYGNAALVAVIELSKRVLELEKLLKAKGE